jgi:ATP-dependent RNA helicase DDX42
MSALETGAGAAPAAKRRRQRDRLDVEVGDDGVEYIGTGGGGGGDGGAAAAPGHGFDGDGDGEGDSGRGGVDGDGRQRHASDLLLPPVDHTSVAYPGVVRDLYTALPRLVLASPEDARAALLRVGVVATGSLSARVHAPIDRFQDLALTLPKPLLGVLLTKYAEPTPVQRAVIPAALAGSDVVAVAKTGSGKTVAFVLPLLAHIAAQDRRDAGVSGAGPSALILAPTRELALQIAQVVRGFAGAIGVGVACVVGGVSKYEQFKQLRDGRAGVVVLTPGRFIDMVRMKACALTSVTFVVLDEADRMVEAMGFGSQVRTVLSQVRPDAQKVFVSATFPKSIDHLARRYLSADAVRLVAGRGREAVLPSSPSGRSLAPAPAPPAAAAEAAAAAASVALVAEEVTEHFVPVRSESGRLEWLTGHLPAILRDGLAIVFCSTRGGTAALANELRARGYVTACIHGETEMADRSGLMRMFRSGELQLLVATDVAARGLDVDGVRTVVNYEPAKTYEDHVHRSGRTGRAGAKGKAFTLLLSTAARDVAFAQSAIAALRAAHVAVPPTLASASSRPAGGRRGGRLSRRGLGGRGERGGRGLRR